MVYSGKKTYDSSGNTSTSFCYFVYILKDRETGEILASNYVHSPRLVVGQTTINQSIEIISRYQLSKDKKYILELVGKSW